MSPNHTNKGLSLHSSLGTQRGRQTVMDGQIDRQELVQQAHTHRLTSDLKSQIIADNVLRNYSRVTV